MMSRLARCVIEGADHSDLCGLFVLQPALFSLFNMVIYCPDISIEHHHLLAIHVHTLLLFSRRI